MMDMVVIADIKSKIENGRCTGHYFAVARNYKAILEKTHRVRIAGGPVYSKEFSNEELLELPYDVDDNSSEPVKKIKSLLNARSLFRQVKDEIIVLQQSTATTSFVAIWLFAPSNSRLYMIQYDLSGLRGYIHRLLYRLAKPKIKGVICPNNTVGKAFGLPYLVVTDYIYTETMGLQDFIPFINRKYDFCIVGRLNEDKGILQTISFLSNNKNSKYKVIIAGKPEGTEDFIEKLNDAVRKTSNVESKMGYVDDKEYLNIIRQSKYTILNYNGDYTVRSSGVVFDFLYNNVPVIAHQCQAMDFVEKYGMGLCYNKLEDIDLSVIVKEKVHEDYLENIKQFKSISSEYISKINSFLK